jgi:hypothetical protein
LHGCVTYILLRCMVVSFYDCNHFE